MIEKNINEALIKADPASVVLVKSLYEIDKELQFTSASVYHKFPIYPSIEEENSVAAKIVFISKDHGVFIFETAQLIEREPFSITDLEYNLGEVDRLIYAKIWKGSPILQKNRRTLKIDIQSYIFISGMASSKTIHSEFLIINTKEELQKTIASEYEEDKLDDKEFKDLKATIEGSKGIIKSKTRIIENYEDLKNSKGAILSKIEKEIYNFDLEQKRAALFTIDGAQRIRGLAGSGKTIILTMKAALIHLQFPNAKVLYTYYTKSLNDIIKRLITRFYRQFSDKDPDWDLIQIMHAWGGRALEGVYYNSSLQNNVAPINFLTAKSKNSSNPFDYVCKDLDQYELQKEYDYVLIDEAQDFPNSFYRICRKIAKNDRVVWAYDDFQNILNIDIQDEKETFGKDESDKYRIDFSRKEDDLQDIVLYKCYRNPRKILISAFALGLGVYNKTEKGYEVIQRLENNEHWESLGFNVLEGTSKDYDEMVIERPSNNSFLIKDSLLDSSSIIQVFKADNIENEVDKMVDNILQDIKKELRPEDISVVCMDSFNVKKYFRSIENKLVEHDIKCFNLLKVSSSNTYYKVPNHVSLSTIYNAKGNEAGSIYICGIDVVFSNKNDIVARNKIFTAMTRSLAWVNLSGIGDSVDFCVQEINDLRNNDFKLMFTQPSEDDVKTIKQGITKKQQLLNKIERLAEDIIKETGESKDEIVEQLKFKFFKKK